MSAIEWSKEWADQQKAKAKMKKHLRNYNITVTLTHTLPLEDASSMKPVL